MLRRIVARRVHDPEAIAEAAANRVRAESPFVRQAGIAW